MVNFLFYFNHTVQGSYSIQSCRLTGIGIPIREIRLSHYRDIFIMETPYTEAQPRLHRFNANVLILGGTQNHSNK